MRFITVDLETWWDTDHTLSKMSPIAYCMSPKTQIISLGLKVDHHPTEVAFGEAAIKALCAKIDWSNTMVIAHNMSGFDAMILAWRLGVKPKMWGCTLSMARPIHAKTSGLSLGKLVEYYGIGVKDQTALVQTKGKRLEDFTQDELDAMREYNRQDVEQCYALFQKLKPHYTAKELWQIDATIRMLVEPKFELDTALLDTALSVERDHKRRAILTVARHLKRSGLASDELESCTTLEDLEKAVRKDLASALRFAKLLETLGVEVPMKPSPTDPSKEVPALAKTDEAFLALQEHENETVAAAARARLAVKSTLLETRIQAFMEAASATGGRLPVPLNYCGADTTGRWSGWAYNPQNLPRITPGRPKTSDALRKSMRAPKGHKVVVADLSGIELRVNHFLWRVPSSMELYQRDRKADLYRAFAAARYGVAPEEVTKEQRQLAKLCLAEGTLVLTQRGEVPIEQVTASDKVWDGVEWVSTLGAVYKGVKHVIAYDGLTATPDHEVWVEDGRKVTLGYAATQSLRLARTGDSGIPLGFGGAGVERSAPGQGIPVCEGAVYELPDGEVGVVRQPAGGEDAGVSVMPPEVWGANLAAATAGSGAATLHESERPRVQTLWGERGSVSVPERSAGGGVGGEQPWVAQGQGAGSDRQQRPLRAGQPAVGDATPERRKPGPGQVEGVSYVSVNAPGSSLRRQYAQEPAAQGPHVRSDSGEVEPPVRQAERRVWDLLNCGPRHRFTANGRLVSNCQLGLGFGAGWRTFKRVAKLMGGLELSDDEAEAVTTAWRTEYAEIVEGWRKCHAALQYIYDGEEVPVDPWGLCVTTGEGIRLPSGRLIRYPALRVEQSDDGKTEWWYGEGRHKARIYAGKITENCLAEGTLVLTDSGWKPIETISVGDLVHDGVEFVRHAGTVFKSVQGCITLDGVYMTPDHKVLTDDGWQEASQVQRPYRPDIRGVDCAAPGGVHGQVVEVAVSVSVRPADSETGVGRCEGSQARGYAELRLSHKATDFQGQHPARDVKAPGVRCLALYARQVQAAVAQGVQKLRRAWDHGLRAVAGVFRELLGGHGAYVPAWAGLGSGGQRRPVLAGELPVGKQANQHDEQAQLTARGGCSGTEPEARHQPQHDLLPTSARVEPGRTGAHTVSRKPVYDIINCGPRHRFVVKGESGPMVVHNCVQALARDIIADNAVEFFRASGLRPSLMVHDELVYIVPQGDAEAALETLQNIMRTPPKWWPDLITDSEGDIADTYGDAK